MIPVGKLYDVFEPIDREPWQPAFELRQCGLITCQDIESDEGCASISCRSESLATPSLLEQRVDQVHQPCAGQRRDAELIPSRGGSLSDPSFGPPSHIEL
jgi:hypothetical protein